MSAFKGYTNDVPGENNNDLIKIIIITIVCIEAPDVKSSPCGNTVENCQGITFKTDTVVLHVAA